MEGERDIDRVRVRERERERRRGNGEIGKEIWYKSYINIWEINHHQIYLEYGFKCKFIKYPSGLNAK